MLSLSSCCTALVLEQAPLALVGATTLKALCPASTRARPHRRSRSCHDLPNQCGGTAQRALRFALGVNEWTCEHVQAADTALVCSFHAILQLSNVLLDGTLPSNEELLDVALICI